MMAIYEGCQYHCSFCMYEHVKVTQPLNATDSMKEQDWLELLSNAYDRGFRNVCIGGRGEPTLHPAFTQIVVKAYKLGFRIYLFSNGLNDQAIIKVLPLLSKLKINLGSTDQTVMSAIHKPAPGFTFDRCTASVGRLIRSIVEKNLKLTLHLSYVVTKQSIHQLFSFPKEVHALFSSELKTRPLHVNYEHFINYVKTFGDDLELNSDDLKKLLGLLLEQADNEFLLRHTNLSKFIKQTQDLIQKMELMPANPEPTGNSLYSCSVYKNVLYVDGNGDCYRCYLPYRIVNGLPAEKDPFFIGNLLKLRFEDVLHRSESIKPDMDVANPYWRTCLTCGAKGR